MRYRLTNFTFPPFGRSVYCGPRAGGPPARGLSRFVDYIPEGFKNVSRYLKLG